jgi:hypothetical protein
MAGAANVNGGLNLRSWDRLPTPHPASFIMHDRCDCESFFATTNHGADGAGPAAGAEKIGRGRVNTGNLFGGLAPSSQRHYSEHCCRMVNDDALLC